MRSLYQTAHRVLQRCQLGRIAPTPLKLIDRIEGTSVRKKPVPYLHPRFNFLSAEMKMYSSTMVRAVLGVLPLLASLAALAQEQTRWVNRDNVLLREGPSLKHKPMGAFARGSMLTLVSDGEDGGYCKVAGDGVEGFLSCKFLSMEHIERSGDDSSLPGFTFAEAESKSVFLTPTTTHVGETPLRPGSGWFALVPEGNGWELVKTELKSRRVEGGITLYDVELSSTHPKAIAFFRLPEMKPGPVSVPGAILKMPLFDFQRMANRAYPKRTLTFDGNQYHFYVKELSTLIDDGNGKSSLVKYGELHVRMGDYDAPLGLTGDSPWDDYAKITWVGDIDGDGKLDLITNVQGSNSGGSCLYLSGAATGKQLFGPATCHIGTGC